MTTGVHVVSDVYCNQCSALIGWTYVKAYEEDQKYKEGKFIIEKHYMTKVGAEPRQSRPSTTTENEESSAERRERMINSVLERAGNSNSISLTNILPALRGQILRQALGLNRVQSQIQRESSDDDSF